LNNPDWYPPLPPRYFNNLQLCTKCQGDFWSTVLSELCPNCKKPPKVEEPISLERTNNYILIYQNEWGDAFVDFRGTKEECESKAREMSGDLFTLLIAKDDTI